MTRQSPELCTVLYNIILSSVSFTRLFVSLETRKSKVKLVRGMSVVNCVVGFPGHQLADGLPELVQFHRRATKAMFSGSSLLNCSVKEVYPEYFDGVANETGFYPEKSGRGMIQRGVIDVLASPIRLDVFDNPFAVKIDVGIRSSKLILASLQLPDRFDSNTILQSMNPFHPVVYSYLFLLAVLLSVVMTCSHHMLIALRHSRGGYQYGLHDIRFFASNLSQILQSVILRTTIKTPMTRSFGEKVIWMSIWFTLLVMSYGYINGLFSTDLNFKVKPDRVESLEDILRLNATPMIFAQSNCIMDFVSAPEGSILNRVYKVMQERKTVIVVGNSDDTESIMTVGRRVAKLVQDPKYVLIEHDGYMQIFIRMIDAFFYWSQKGTKRDGNMRKGKESSHPVVWGLGLRPDIDDYSRQVINQHLRRGLVESGCHEQFFENFITTSLAMNPEAPETFESKQKADFDYFDRKERDARHYPDLPEPFNLQFMAPLVYLCAWLYFLNLIVLLCEIIFQKLVHVTSVYLVKKRQKRKKSTIKRLSKDQIQDVWMSRTNEKVNWRLVGQVNGNINVVTLVQI